MFQPPAAPGAGHGAHVPPTIAMGGGSFDTPAADGSTALRRHPDWIKARLPSGENYHELKGILRGLSLNTVCEEAHCPNIGECWEQRTATIMILGDVCTRACGFCAVKTGRPTWNDEDEPRRVAEAIAAMRLEHVVVTSVARDDLPDGGAHIFAKTILALREECPGMGVEVLIPDFNGQRRAAADGHGGRARHPQSQPGDGRAAPEAGSQAGALPALARGPAAGEGVRSREHRARRQRPHKVEPDGRPG